MAVHHRLHVGPRAQNLAVDEALEEHGTALRVERRAVEIEFHDVARLDQARGHAAREPEAARIVGVAQADMTEPVEHALAEEDAIGRDEIGNERLVHGHLP